MVNQVIDSYTRQNAAPAIIVENGTNRLRSHRVIIVRRSRIKCCGVTLPPRGRNHRTIHPLGARRSNRLQVTTLKMPATIPKINIPIAMRVGLLDQK